jgi:ubiquinone/menaquinone biosynthesis C-methylase UbiE
MVRDAVRAGAAAGRGVAGRAAGLSRAATASLLGPLARAHGRRPDRERALAGYRDLADEYDVLTASGEPYRRRAVRALALKPGEVVLDVGCGTGLNLPALCEAVGAAGRVVGIDQSAEMLTRAAARAGNLIDVTLVRAPAEEAAMPRGADAALLCGTHDILRSERALRNVLGHLRPGGRVVAGGAKWAPWWQPGAVALNLWTWQVNRPYVTTFEGFDRPWSVLERLVPDLVVEEILVGGGYVAVGRVPVR